MTAPATLPRAGSPRARTVEAVLAHAHLRLGALALARVELETMAGLGLLDPSGLVDLAEVRWRTGDLLGAGEAANAALRANENVPVALIIAAEAAVAVGRPTEARRFAARVLADLPAGIDGIFAGMPRSSVWPGDAAEPPPTAPTLFDREPDLPVRTDESAPAGDDGPAAEPGRPVSTAAPVAIGFWDGEAGIEPASAPAPDPAMELEAGREALVAGALEEAALRFGLALRFAPSLAPAILEATDGARGASLTILRGDAYRVAGHEEEARQAYAMAANGGLPERRSRPRPKAGLGVADPATEIGVDAETEPGAEAANEPDGVAAAPTEPDAAAAAPSEPDAVGATGRPAGSASDAEIAGEIAGKAVPGGEQAPPAEVDADPPAGTGGAGGAPIV